MIYISRESSYLLSSTFRNVILVLNQTAQIEESLKDTAIVYLKPLIGVSFCTNDLYVRNHEQKLINIPKLICRSRLVLNVIACRIITLHQRVRTSFVHY